MLAAELDTYLGANQGSGFADLSAYDRGFMGAAAYDTTATTSRTAPIAATKPAAGAGGKLKVKGKLGTLVSLGSTLLSMVGLGGGEAELAPADVSELASALPTPGAGVNGWEAGPWNNNRTSYSVDCFWSTTITAITVPVGTTNGSLSINNTIVGTNQACGGTVTSNSWAAYKNNTLCSSTAVANHSMSGTVAPGTNLNLTLGYSAWFAGACAGTGPDQLRGNFASLTGNPDATSNGGQTSDPLTAARTLVVEGSCRLWAAPNTVSSVTSTSNSFTLTDLSNGQTIVEIPPVSCPDGAYLESAATKVRTAGQDDYPIAEPYTAPQLVRDFATTYPACATSTAACVLDVQVRVSTSPETWASCSASNAPAVCTSLATAPAPQDIARCVYGVVGSQTAVAWERCAPLLPVPEATGTGSDTGDCEIGLGDVLTGRVVYKAVSCAIRWAFVPAPSAWTQASGTIGAAWSATAPAVLLDAAGDVFGPWLTLDPSGDCEGPAIDASAVGLPADFRPLNTCSDGASQAMGFWVPFSTFVVGAASFLTGARMVLSAFGVRESVADDGPSVGGSSL